MSATVEVLNAIRDEFGTLTPELVVDVARDPEHPLHTRFEWDDSIAAEKWRLTQAGEILRVTYRPDPTKPTDLRAFMAVKNEESPRSEYVPTQEALADPFTRQLILSRMKREAKQFADRYSHMAEYASVVADMAKDGAA